MTSAELIDAIDRFAAAHSLAGATVTSRAVGNSRLYGRLLVGRSCTLDVADRLKRYIAAHTSPVPDPDHTAPLSDPAVVPADQAAPVTHCPENEVSPDA